MTRRDEWRKCVEDHAREDWGTTCDSCFYLPEVYARMEALEQTLYELMMSTAMARFPGQKSTREYAETMKRARALSADSGPEWRHP